MTETIYSINEIKNIVTPIAQKYEVDRVFLFGSYARGEATVSSDLDFIIDKGRLRGLKFAGMLGDLQETFHKHVDLLTSVGVTEDDFKQQIGKDLVVVYGA